MGICFTTCAIYWSERSPAHSHSLGDTYFVSPCPASRSLVSLQAGTKFFPSAPVHSHRTQLNSRGETEREGKKPKLVFLLSHALRERDESHKARLLSAFNSHGRVIVGLAVHAWFGPMLLSLSYSSAKTALHQLYPRTV